MRWSICKMKFLADVICVEQIHLHWRLCRSQQVRAPLHPIFPYSSQTSGWGELTCRVACKPLLSMCSKVICQLSCSCRQSFGEIAHILVHPRSHLSWNWARPLALYLLSLLPFISFSCTLSTVCLVPVFHNLFCLNFLCIIFCFL